ncbi:hypothetical protein JW949_02175 [Candidatus Woesearchaeota archaeon]|nr:hypothetical protein [Candidatus Woesearchaeota archaeon]
MNIDIKEKNKKPLMQREEFIGKISFKGPMPSRTELKKEIAKKLNKKEELIIIRKINPFYGKESADVYGFVYNNKKALEELEEDYMKKRNSEKKEAEEGSEQKKPEEEKQPKKAEEKPNKEKEFKEEPKPDEKDNEPKEETVENKDE